MILKLPLVGSVRMVPDMHAVNCFSSGVIHDGRMRFFDLYTFARGVQSGLDAGDTRKIGILEEDTFASIAGMVIFMSAC